MYIDGSMVSFYKRSQTNLFISFWNISTSAPAAEIFNVLLNAVYA